MPVNNPALAPTIAPKSVQRGVITIANAAGSGTATVAAVNTAKTELRHDGQNSAQAAQAEALATLVLTNSTTITATRAGTSGSTPVSWELTEWN